MSWLNDLAAVLRGLQKVNAAFIAHQQQELRQFWKNSSLRPAAQTVCQTAEEKFSDFMVAEKFGKCCPSKSSSKYDQFHDNVNASKNDESSTQKKTDPTDAQGRTTFHTSDFSSKGQIRGTVLQAVRKFSSWKAGESSRTLCSLYTNRNHSNGMVKFYSNKSNRESGKSNKPIAKDLKMKLNEEAKESKVPGSRISRLLSFGSLGASLAIGTLSEAAKKSMNVSGQDASGTATVSVMDKNPFLSGANAERIVSTLCRVRGAALKLGQMLSIQDNSLINPDLQKVFERVRQSADFMPVWQMERVMSTELGVDWKSKFKEFDSKPFAAASIGQVHRAVLLDGRTVAIKVQYPGVANSINSDVDNLMSLLKVWAILPEGLFAKTALDVAKRELSWECDYIREAKCSERFRNILKDDPVFYIPEVIWELTTKQVLTTELVRGDSVDKLVDSDQTTRNMICENLLRLCLHEVFIFNFMQTDPNWSNFLYDSDSGRITLLDFGASREYSRNFTDVYIRVIKAASDRDRKEVLAGSHKLKFLTGFETKVMEKAHIDAVMILGEAFATEAPFDFGRQNTAARIQELVPVMLKHRLTPPPEESYSLHRKMSGCFLLCAKLRASIPCKQMFDDVWTKYHQRQEEEKEKGIMNVYSPK